MSSDDKSILQWVKDAISGREDKDDEKSRVGSGGKRRRKSIDDAVDEAQMGRMREGQSTDSNQ